MKKSLIFSIVFLFLISILPREALAYQFSACSTKNYQELSKHLNNVIEIYPEVVLKEILSENFAVPDLYSPDNLRIEGRFLYKGDKRLQGIMVNYFLHKREADLDKLKSDISTGTNEH